MAFLDKQSRVIDFVLTERGRKLYATGKLDFAYFALFDDGIDYDPYSTGSLDAEDRENLIQDLLTFEAPYIPDVMGADAPQEPVSHIFTAAVDYAVIPHMAAPSDGSTLSVQCLQRSEGGLFIREGSNFAEIEMKVEGEHEASPPEYLIRVFSSGSNGLVELDPRRDLKGRICYDPFISISVDDGRRTK